MSDRKTLPGKFVWFELESRDARKAQAFYGEVLGWKIRSVPVGSSSHDMIFTGDTLETMIGGYAPPRTDREPSHWISYASVRDLDVATRAAEASGGKVIEPPMELPEIGRKARIADPQGAELCLLTRTAGDPPDVPLASPGRFFWNELHTPDPEGALSFYERVLGYSHQAMGGDGQAGDYHVLSSGGTGRGGVSGHLPAGVPAHWLPYVAVDDTDAALERARKHGGKVLVGPSDIPGIGRFGVIQDPTGAALAVMKPAPRPASK